MMARLTDCQSRLLERRTSHRGFNLSSVSPFFFFLSLLLTRNPLIASAKNMRVEVKMDTPTSVAGGPSAVAQKKRGQPKGSKNKATLKAEAEAAARGCNLRLCGPQGVVAGFVAPKEEPFEPHAMAAAGGSRLPPSSPAKLVPGTSMKLGPKSYRIGRFGNLPVHEFIVYAGWSGLTRTSLPDPFKPIFDKSL